MYWWSNLSFVSFYFRKRVGGLKLEELPGLESLRIPGVNMIMLIAIVLSISGLSRLLIFHNLSCRLIVGPIK